MKLFLLLCYVLCVGSLLAQEESDWKFIQIPLDAEESLIEETMSSFMESGYYPVGLEVLGGDTISVLGQRRVHSLQNYVLYFFDEIETLPESFAVFLDAGWSPAGAAFHGEGLLALFVESTDRLRAWKILPVEGTTLPERQRSINRMVAAARLEGLEPFALTRWNTDLMIGFVTTHSPDWTNTGGNYLLETYPNDGESFVEGINKRLAEGYRLCGYHFHDGTIYIGFF